MTNVSSACHFRVTRSMVGAAMRILVTEDEPRILSFLARGGRLTRALARRRASLEDRSADLSDREFRLLHHLALHPGEIVSRERLLAEVWGYHFDPGSNVVEVCIRRLRKKLGPEAPIQTVRHAGYRLAEA